MTDQQDLMGLVSQWRKQADDERANGGKPAIQFAEALRYCATDLEFALAGEQERSREAAAQLPAGVPDGWVLVPREPTPEMLRAGFLSESEGFDIETPADAPGLVYRAMLAAAPQPDSQKSGWGVPDSGPGKQSDMATAWLAVVEVLNEVAPQWIEGRGTGIECAVEAIRNLSNSAAPGGDVEQRARELLAVELAKSPGLQNMVGPVLQSRNVGPFTHAAVQAIIAGLSAPKQVVSGWSAEDACEQFIAAEVDSAPEALRRLGDWLCNVLDEDRQKTASAMVIGAMMECSEAIRTASSSAARAAPQPVESEGREVSEDYKRGWMDGAHEAAVLLTEDASEQPAIDLEQFRPAVRWALGHAMTDEFKDRCNRLLAIIDGAKAGRAEGE